MSDQVSDLRSAWLQANGQEQTDEVSESGITPEFNRVAGRDAADGLEQPEADGPDLGGSGSAQISAEVDSQQPQRESTMVASDQPEHNSQPPEEMRRDVDRESFDERWEKEAQDAANIADRYEDLSATYSEQERELEM